MSEPQSRMLTEQPQKNTILPTMMNYTKTGYNIISHKIPFSTSKITCAETFNNVNH